MALMSCPECSKEISDAVSSCPHCGYPLREPQAHDTGPAPSKRKRLLIFAVCSLVLLSAVVFFASSQRQKEVDRAAYIDNLNELLAQTIRGGAIAEDMCNLTKNVWYNTIYEKKDGVTDKFTRLSNGTGSFHDDFNASLR